MLEKRKVIVCMHKREKIFMMTYPCKVAVQPYVAFHLLSIPCESVAKFRKPILHCHENVTATSNKGNSNSFKQVFGLQNPNTKKSSPTYTSWRI